MKKYLVFALLGIIGLFASCENKLVEPQQEIARAENTLRVENQEDFPARVPVTGWSYYGISSHTFTGINGDDFYVLGATNNSKTQSASFDLFEYDAGGNYIGGDSFTVPPKGSYNHTYWTNNRVHSVWVRSLTTGVNGYVNLGSGNQ